MMKEEKRRGGMRWQGGEAKRPVSVCQLAGKEGGDQRLGSGWPGDRQKEASSMAASANDAKIR